MASNPPKSIFGATPSTSSSSTPSLLGNAKPVGSGLFGAGTFGSSDASQSFNTGWNFSAPGTSSAGEKKSSTGATAENKPAAAFGGFGGNIPSFAGLGGSQTPPKPSDGSRFGPGESKGYFGGASTGDTTTTAPAGSTTPAPSGFDFGKPSTTPAGPPPANLLSGSIGGNNLFGSKDKPTGNPFQPAGVSVPLGTAQSSAPGSNPFGAGKPQQPTPVLAWTKPTESSQTTAPASTTNAERQRPLFGGLGQSFSNTPLSTSPSTEPQKPFFNLGLGTSKTPSTNTSSIESQKPLSGGLGQNTFNTASSSAAPSILFQPPTSTAGSAKSNPFLFPSSTPATSQAGTSDTDKPKPFFVGTSSQTPSTTSAPSLGNLFGNPTTTSSATPSANTFSSGATAPGTSAPQTSVSFAAPATSSTAPFGNLFTTPNKPASTTTTAAPRPATTSAATAAPVTTTAGATATGLGASLLGASTAGPAPPAQSRLRNKTMDEILTRWASDLTKYTKEFQSQAETVAHWDQLLVENMSKISKLYISTVTAEKQTASVEMQLSAVENQQNELESWLTKYEGEVDEMLAKDGVGEGMELAGTEQEREKTYKMAERLAERLEDMGRDLGGMIQETNAANAGLGQNLKADEPITQIVRILNSHLSQLQAIDQGTVALQAKIHAAQKASQGLGFSAMNGGSGGNGGGGAVEDFYRSYMGRR